MPATAAHEPAHTGPAATAMASDTAAGPVQPTVIAALDHPAREHPGERVEQWQRALAGLDHMGTLSNTRTPPNAVAQAGWDRRGLLWSHPPMFRGE